MLSKKVLLKVLNAGTALAISGVLLGSALTSSSWAMESDAMDFGPHSHFIWTKAELENICNPQVLPQGNIYGELSIQMQSREMDEVPVSFTNIFKAYPELTMLSITKMTLGCNEDRGAPRIADLSSALRANTTLKSLRLLNCNVDDKGATLLANALQGHPTLKELHLSINKIGDAGAAELGELIKVNHSLKVLKLMGNEMSDTGAFALVKPLYESTNTLQLLDIIGNKKIVALTREEANQIAANLKKKNVVVEF